MGQSMCGRVNAMIVQKVREQMARAGCPLLVAIDSDVSAAIGMDFDWLLNELPSVQPETPTIAPSMWMVLLSGSIGGIVGTSIVLALSRRRSFSAESTLLG